MDLYYLPIYRFFADAGWPLLLSGLINCSLYGLTAAQTIWCLSHYPKDGSYFKISLIVLLVFDTAQTASLLQASWELYFRNKISFAYSPGLILDLYLSCVIVTVVQVAFTYRVWKFSKNWVVACVLALLTFFQFLAGIGVSVLQQISGDIDALHSPVSNAVAVVDFGSTVLCDILIATSLAYYLFKARNGVNGIKSTEGVLERLILYVVGIGLLTTVVAILTFVTFLAVPNRLTFMIFHGIICKFYVNSLLVMLNARSSLRQGLSPRSGDGGCIGFSDLNRDTEASAS